MTFEKALEAMRNGKIVVRKGLDCNCELCMFENAIIRYPFLEPMPYLRACDISACDWEICGEWLKEPEMTARHAVEVLESVRESVRNSYRYIPDIDGVIDYAIEAIEKQNKFEAADDLNNDNESANAERAQEKYNTVIEELHLLLDFYKDNDSCRTKIKNVIERLERDTEPEHKCNACHCNCSHTGKKSDLQVKMEQALSRKFFELEKSSDEESIVNSMLNIYNSIFPD